MLDSEGKKLINKIEREVRRLMFATLFLLISVFGGLYIKLKHPEIWSPQPAVETAEVKEELPEFENGIHLATGFKEGENLDLVIGNCTSCHSAKMVTQNRATRDGWLHMIKWMQETQNLWDLGDNEPLILDYLAKYYAPEKKGRRQQLTNIDWYELEK